MVIWVFFVVACYFDFIFMYSLFFVKERNEVCETRVIREFIVLF